jgi:hypothetical protein
MPVTSGLWHPRNPEGTLLAPRWLRKLPTVGPRIPAQLQKVSELFPQMISAIFGGFLGHQKEPKEVTKACQKVLGKLKNTCPEI